MRAALMYGPGDVRVDTVPDPVPLSDTDVVVEVLAACICGSDLWPYKGVGQAAYPRPMGHEFVGRVVAAGSAVSTATVGSVAIAPFTISDGSCANCRNGMYPSCTSGAGWGSKSAMHGELGGGQAEYVRVPFADATLAIVGQGVGQGVDSALLPNLLTLSDVMATGYHAAVSANVGPGHSVVVVGDGAVGLCAVLSARMLGAERIVVMSRHEDRAALAQAFGATDVVPERGKAGIARIRDMFDGIGADATLECVGTEESMRQALSSARPGGRTGYVGVPNGPELSYSYLFAKNITVGGGVAPVLKYLPALLPAVLAGDIEPGRVFDQRLPIEQTPAGYAAMADRAAIKTMLLPEGT